MVIKDKVGKGDVESRGESIARMAMEDLPEKEKYDKRPEGSERLSYKIPWEEHSRKCSMARTKWNTQGTMRRSAWCQRGE